MADSDYRYIAPLQIKFAEVFGQSIDLEVITEKHYFDAFFSSPQIIDVLIMSDSLDYNNLRRHEILKLFVFKEGENSDTQKLDYVILQKYTNINDVFIKIVSNSLGVLALPNNEKKSPQIISFYSASGGAGKTTLALGVSSALTDNLKKVLYINASRIQTFQRFLKNKEPISDMSFYINYKKLSKDFNGLKKQIKTEKFDYLPALKSSLITLGMPFSVFQVIADTAKNSGEYDYIIVDTDVCFDEANLAILKETDKVIVVATQCENSIYATNLFTQNISDITEDKYMFIYNMCNERNIINTKYKINDYVKMMDADSANNIEKLSTNKDICRLAQLIL